MGSVEKNRRLGVYGLFSNDFYNFGLLNKKREVCISIYNYSNQADNAYLEKQKKDLAAHVIGAKDVNGNTITKIYAKGDEFVIYEIADLPPVESMKVRIFTKVEDNDKPLMNFQAVKDSFDSLKSIMYRMGGDTSYKQRAASAVVMAILGRVDEAKNQFKLIEDDAKTDFLHKVYGRLFYLFGAFLVALIINVLMMIVYIDHGLVDDKISCFLYVMAFAAQGGVLSVSLKAREVISQRAIKYWMYSIYGAEREMIAVIAGIATYILIKSGILFASIVDGERQIYFILSICLVSGFSETLIPNYLGRLEQNALEKKR